MSHPKITDGANDRPREAPIGQSAGGLPDDSSEPVAIDDAAVARIAAALGVPVDDADADESEAHPS